MGPKKRSSEVVKNVGVRGLQQVRSEERTKDFGEGVSSKVIPPTKNKTRKNIKKTTQPDSVGTVAPSTNINNLPSNVNIGVEPPPVALNIENTVNPSSNLPIIITYDGKPSPVIPRTPSLSTSLERRSGVLTNSLRNYLVATQQIVCILFYIRSLYTFQPICQNVRLYQTRAFNWY